MVFLKNQLDELCDLVKTTYNIDLYDLRIRVIVKKEKVEIEKTVWWEILHNTVCKKRACGQAFFDKNRIIAEDIEHSHSEKRYYCFGNLGDAIMTVRFTHRGMKIRIIGAGYWRQVKKIYEKAQKDKLHQ
jgi:uncharacterized DUF497 family protein